MFIASVLLEASPVVRLFVRTSLLMPVPIVPLSVPVVEGVTLLWLFMPMEPVVVPLNAGEAPVVPVAAL